jgi:hypothetical protein
MKEIIARFEQVLATAPRRLVEISELEAVRKPRPDRWSRKEILGHLIDSAGNSHQRWVRAQLTPLLEFPGYEQEPWVARQAYVTEPWADLVNLWLLFNRHMLHVLKAMPPEVLSHQVAIGGKPPLPLSDWLVDYVSHMEKHLAQIFSVPAEAAS